MLKNDLILVIGGARSGKSRFALERVEGLANQRGMRPGMLATAQAFDDEMAHRIKAHKQERGDHWLAVEEPLEIAGALLSFAPQCGAIVVDCLTLWLSNIMHHERAIGAETDALLQALSTVACPVVMVSNEVGLGLVPETPLGRSFRDEQGRLNQRMAAACNQVVFLAAGLPLYLKGSASSSRPG